MQKSRLQNKTLALWLAPLVSTLPLIPFFSIRSSPLFLGTLMGDPTHPMTWRWWGPLLSAMGVVFDGTILGYLTGMMLALPIWLGLRERGKLSTVRVAPLFALVGIAASQLVHLLARFREPELMAFASSWLSPVLGSICGMTAGVFALYFSKLRVRGGLRPFIYSVPLVVMFYCGATMLWSAQAWRGR